MTRLSTGLFAASSATEAVESGYANVWVRDNVYVAFSHQMRSRTDVAVGVARALLRFFDRHRGRFERIIHGSVDPADVRQRPHVRFNGETLEEIDVRWPHAQNDALGYTLWLSANLARQGAMKLSATERFVLALFPRYFKAIRYWEDEDSGHWEETRKVSASSIGTVVAGLEAYAVAIREAPSRKDLSVEVAQAVSLAARGREALRAILPHECAKPDSAQRREFDAALVFLLYPLNVIRDHAVAGQILDGIHRHLEGDFGIRRYPGDSYWAPDYEDRLAAQDRTRDFSEDIASRDALLERVGEEAQWCLFDPLLSAYYGARYRQSGHVADLEQQSRHLTRALGQLTPSWACPELYYLRHGAYVPNPHTPLLWTQANLAVALHSMRDSLVEVRS
jgi:phosphorylase kinase alpha/beta subunit